MSLRQLLPSFACLAWILLILDGQPAMALNCQGEDDPIDQVQAAIPDGEQPQEEQQGEEKKTDEPDDEEMVEVAPLPVEEIGPREIRFHLWDGSIVTGDVGVSAIHIKTRFGMLEVPVANIVTFQPGLNSLPDLKAEIDQLVSELGEREFQTRERAKQMLLAKGVAFYDYLTQFNVNENAEQKKNMSAILESFADELDDDMEGFSRQQRLGAEDSITTATFTIVGEIQEMGFDLVTAYGDLKIALKDVQTADRSFKMAGQVVSKKIEVDAVAFFQRTPKETKIRVNAGDRISIRTTGTVQWASWGDVSSTPEGIPSHGVFEGIPSGALAARIGKSGEYIKIGEKADFVAKSSGELILGIAMQENYARQNGYQWNGSYKASVRVESGARN